MKSDRDPSMDRLLADALKARAVAMPGTACLDAETLAAWADGGLDARERAAAEAHAADCARCQQLLAAMVRTSPPPAVERPWWRTPMLGWLVPVTAAATALAIWVAVPKPPSPATAEVPTTVDRIEPPPPTAPAPPAEQRFAPETQSAQAGGTALPKANSPAPELQDRVSRDQRAASPTAEAAPTLRERRETESLEKKESFAPAVADNSNAVGAAPSPGAPAASAGAALSGAPPPAPPAAARRDLAALPRQAFANRPEVVIVSSNPSTRFRLLPDGGVQRSADAGSTWRTEATGVTDALTAGDSPSPSVCWLVGPAGAVLLSTDGRSWRRVTSPDPADLRGVRAVDSENATVTAVDGRAVVTADGGRTWSRSPNP